MHIVLGVFRIHSGFHEYPEWPRSFLSGFSFGVGGGAGRPASTLPGGGCRVTQLNLDFAVGESSPRRRLGDLGSRGSCTVCAPPRNPAPARPPERLPGRMFSRSLPRGWTREFHERTEERAPAEIWESSIVCGVYPAGTSRVIGGGT